MRGALGTRMSKSHIDKLQSNTASDIDIIWVVMQRFDPNNGCEGDYFRYEMLKDGNNYEVFQNF